MVWIEVGAYLFLVEESQPKKKFGAVLPAPNGSSYVGIVMIPVSGSIHDVQDPFHSGPYATAAEAKEAIEQKVGMV